MREEALEVGEVCRGEVGREIERNPDGTHEHASYLVLELPKDKIARLFHALGSDPSSAHSRATRQGGENDRVKAARWHHPSSLPVVMQAIEVEILRDMPCEVKECCRSRRGELVPQRQPHMHAVEFSPAAERELHVGVRPSAGEDSLTGEWGRRCSNPVLVTVMVLTHCAPVDAIVIFRRCEAVLREIDPSSIPFRVNLEGDGW